jgi:hypothetical protein
MFEQKLRNVGLGQWLNTQIYRPKIKGLNPGRERERERERQTDRQTERENGRNQVYILST